MAESVVKDRRGSGEGSANPSNTPNSTTPTPTSTSTSTSINNLAEDAQVRHTPSDHGYAKIVGEEFTHVLREKKLQIGRIMPIHKPGLLGISSAKNISRVHSELSYIPHPEHANAAGHWQMLCIGKNGMQRNEEFMPANETFIVKHKDRLTMGDTTFYFLEPIPMSRSITRT